MPSKFDQGKYKKIFEQRYGAGSFETGLSQARKVGTTKAQAAFEKDAYAARLKAAEKAAKEAERAAKNKTYDDALNYWKSNTDKIREQGAARNAENIRNDPRLQEQIKAEGYKVDDYIDAMYAAVSDGEVRSEREYKQFASGLKKEAKKKEEDPLSYLEDVKEEKPKKKKEDKGFFGNAFDKLKKSEVGRAAKAAEDFFNPFDKEKSKDAAKKYIDKGPSKTTQELARGANRVIDSASLGALSNLDKRVNDRDPIYNSQRSFGEGGGTDMITSGLGYLVPGVGAVKATRAAGLGVKAGSTGLQKFGQIAREGAVTGAGIGAAEVGIRESLNGEDTDFRDNLKHIGIGAAAGAVADPLLHGLGDLASTGLGKLAKGNVPTFSGKPSANVLEQLRPQQSRGYGDSDSLYSRLQGLAKPQTEAAAATIETPSFDRLRSGRDFEAIEADNGGSLRLADNQPQINHAVGNADTFRSKVSREAPKKKDGILSNLRTQFIDDVAPLEGLEKRITGEISSAENSIYKQARLYKGSPEKANLIVQEQLVPIFNEVKKKGLSLDDLGDYALAVHAKDVNSQGINSGFTNAEIDDVINRLGTPEMESARKSLVEVNNNTLDMLSTGDSPVLDPDSVKAMREKWPNYMSLFRNFDDDKIEFASGLSNALSVGSSPINKLKGSSRDVIDPIESIVKNIYKATSVADRNNVASKLGRLANKDAEGNYVRKLADGEDAGRVNVISVMNKGKAEKYEVPPDVYKAMKNLDKESTNTLIKILQKPASTLRAGATLTPEFSLRNPLRDVPNAFVVSESGFNPVVDFPIGLWQSIWKGRSIKIGNKEFKTHGDLYKQFIKENGGYGNIVSMDRELHRETLQKALTDASTQFVDVLDPKTYKAVMKKYANPLNTLRKVADISETATKVGEFRAALRSGTSKEEAAYRARDIMDFGRAGVSVREANKVVAFLNANIQGKSKLWRAFQANPGKVFGKAVAAVTFPTIGAIVAQETMSNQRQKEILDDAPQWLKDTFYLVPVPGTDQIARIPKPFDLAYPFSNTLERAFDFAKKNDKEAFDGFIKQSFSAMAVPTMLTGIAPIVEGMANYSFFRQGPIIPKREENVDFPDQHDVNTSETAKLLGKGFNKLNNGDGPFKNFGSPRVVDNTIQGFAGGLGTYSTSIIDMFIDGVSSSDEPVKPAKNIDQKPVTKAFLVNQSGSGESLDKLYSLKEKLTKARGSAKQNEKPFADEAKYKYVNAVTKDIGEINKTVRAVENSRELSAQQKRQHLDQLIKQRNRMAKQAYDGIKNAE